ncbi:MAG: hypothetical protein JWN13_4924 [Betaproteobacteria bacterium]|nr:hypothetical protein [Betaproteobacteria bacterium]
MRVRLDVGGNATHGASKDPTSFPLMRPNVKWSDEKQLNAITPDENQLNTVLSLTHLLSTRR